MENTLHKIWKFFGSTAFHIAMSFLLSGSLTGALFAWVTHLPALAEFFFIPDGKMPEVRFSWYIAFILFLILGIILGFIVSLQRINFIGKFRLTVARSLLACLIVSATIPFFYMLFGNVSFIDAVLILLVIPILFLPLFSLAMCFTTRSLCLLPVAFLASIVSLAVAVGFHLMTFWLLRNQGSYAVEFFELTGLFSSLSLCFGLWLLWRVRKQ